MDDIIKRMQQLAFHHNKPKMLNESINEEFPRKGQHKDFTFMSFIESPTGEEIDVTVEASAWGGWSGRYDGGMKIEPDEEPSIEIVDVVDANGNSYIDQISENDLERFQDLATNKLSECQEVNEWDTDPGEEQAQRSEAVQANTEEMIKTLAAKGLTPEIIFHKIEELSARPITPYSYESNDFLDGDELANAIERIIGLRPEITEGWTIQELDMAGYSSDFDRMLEMAGIFKTKR
jgi:hypothetical protein